jgi:hypothetical protein
MFAALGMLMGFRVIESIAREKSGASKVPEPPFAPFVFPAGRKGAFAAEVAAGERVRAAAVVPANSAREPRTLEELGVPRALAKELEATLVVMGAAGGGGEVGYTFRTTNGVSHALRLATTPGERASERAA